MLHNLLRDYRDWLLQSYSRETADKYRHNLAVLLAGQSVSDPINNLDVGLVLGKLSDVKYKNYFSQSKNAFLHFCEFAGINLSADTLAQIEELQDKSKKKHRKLKPVEYNQIEDKIKQLRNMKLKLSYQTIIVTGLRISELSDLSPKDCSITADTITFSFIGKGSKTGTVEISKTDCPLLFERVTALITSTPANKKVFYSAVYLQKQATELGFACHDLRRVFAKLEYKKCKNKTEISEKLRHSNIRTTNIYLKSKVQL